MDLRRRQLPAEPAGDLSDHLIDLKRALCWIREQIAEFGGDPCFVASSGGSAGGHLSSLLALTAGDPEYQPGFEEVDTSVRACVPFYGVYDLTNQHGLQAQPGIDRFFGRMVLKKRFAEEPDAFRRASPMHRIHADAPPFFVIHGSHDSLAPVEEARQFATLLRETSKAPVAYAEIPGAQHAFEVFHSRRTTHVVRAVGRFWLHILSISPGGARARAEGPELILPARSTPMRCMAALALVWIALAGLPIRSIGAETATLDAVDVQDLGEELLATRDGSSPTRIRLEKREKVIWSGAQGIVGVALTDRRFLAVSPNSMGWQEARLWAIDGRSPELKLAANVALLISPKRVLGFDGGSGRFTESRLTPLEAVLASGADEHVGVVVTNRRVIGWASRFGGPADRALEVHESFVSLRVLSRTASVRTSDRVLIFSSSSGLWRDEALPLH
jgi:dienelactone hydrolase